MGPKIVVLDSYFHYKAVETADGKITLLEFQDDGACPKMGDREDFDDEEGSLVATWEPGEVVMFVYQAHTGVLGATDFVMCGDDVPYHIQVQE